MNLGGKFIVFIKYLLFGNTVQKKRAKQELAYRLANLFGDFPFSEGDQIWREDSAFLEDYKRLSPHNDFSQDRKFILRELSFFVSNRDGDIAECGTYKGGSAFFIAQGCPKTDIYLVDSFEGISEPSAKDAPASKDIYRWKKGDLSSPLETAQKNLSKFENVHYFKGWIPDVLDLLPASQYKLVHLDLDLYTPTLSALEYFYPKIHHHGIIVLDDYGFKTCPGVKKAADEFVKSRQIKLILLTSGQGIILKP